MQRSRRASRSSSESTVAWAVLAFVVLGGALRFLTLDTQSFELDESVTVALLHHSFSGMLGTIPETETTPPLYYVLAWLWTRAFGVNEIGLRSLSALLGTAMIPLAYTTGRRLISANAGLIAAGLTAVSPWLLWYSQEARAYALLALLSLASFSSFTVAVEAPTRRAVSTWAVVSALALAAHYFAVFLVIPEAAWLLYCTNRRRVVLAATAFVGLVGAALLPLALEQEHGIGGKAGFLQTPLASRITAIPTRFLVGEYAPASSKAALVILAIIMVIVGGVGLLRDTELARIRTLWIAFSAVAFALIFPIVLAFVGRDYLDARNLVGTWTPLIIVLAGGYAAMGRVGLAAAIGLGVLFLAMSVVGSIDSAVQRTDYRGIASTLGPSPGRGERAIVVSPDFNWTPLAYYLPHYPQLGAGSAGVREVDIIGWDTQALSHEAVTTLERRGFRVIAERTVQKLRVVKLRASSVQSVSRAELVHARLGDQSATVLIQSDE
jgi:mannosyltransferase